jgi:hypothetical protein
VRSRGVVREIGVPRALDARYDLLIIVPFVATETQSHPSQSHFSLLSLHHRETHNLQP